MLTLRPTGKFSVWDVAEDMRFSSAPGALAAVVELDCDYTASRVAAALARRGGRWGSATPCPRGGRRRGLCVQWREYGAIEWEKVLSGRTVASSYCVRKGLSRKAQFWQACRRHFMKHPEAAALLRSGAPHTVVVETWEAFDEDMKLDFGGGDVASFGADTLSVAQRLDLCLTEAREAMEGSKENGGNRGTACGSSSRRMRTRARRSRCSGASRSWRRTCS